MSLKDALYNYIGTQGYVSYGDMCQKVAELGYKIGTGERELRKLVENNLVENEFKKSKRNTDYISGYFLKGEAPKPEIRYVILDGEVKYL